MVRLIERDTGGIFNAAAPPEPWDRVLAGFRPLSERPVRFVRPPAAIIEELKLDFPLVAPTIAGGHVANERTTYDGRRAAAAKYWPTTEQEKAVLVHMSRS